MSRRLALAILATSCLAWLSMATPTSATSPTSLEDELLRSATLVFTPVPHAIAPGALGRDTPVNGRTRLMRLCGAGDSSTCRPRLAYGGMRSPTIFET